MNVEKSEILKFEETLLNKGYQRYRGHFKNEDYGYWKSFHVEYDNSSEKSIGYQIGILFYDFSKNDSNLQYGIQFEFILGNNSNIERLDMMVSDKIFSIEDFESLSEKFYTEIYLNHIKKKEPIEQ